MMSYENTKRVENRVIEITPTIGCPNNCVYCPQNTLIKKYFSNKNNSRQLDMESFCKILDKLPKDVIVDFAGFVEPFTNPYARQMMLEASRRGFTVDLFTTLRNATLDDLNAISSIPFELFYVHLPDKHHAMQLDLTDEYIEKLKFVLEKFPQARFLLFGEPHEIIRDMLPGRLWVDAIVLRGNNLDKESIPSNIPFQIEKLPDYSHTPILCARELRRLKPSRSHKTDQPVLLPNGDLVLCCMDYGMQHVLGNIFTQSYDEIMEGEEAIRIAKGMRREIDYPVLCDQCEWAIPYDKEKWERSVRINIYTKGNSKSFLNFWKDSWEDRYHYYVQLSWGNTEFIRKILNFQTGKSDYYIFGKKIW